MSDYDFNHVTKGAADPVYFKFSGDSTHVCVGYTGDFEADPSIEEEDVEVGCPLKRVGTLPNRKKCEGSLQMFELSARNICIASGMDPSTDSTDSQTCTVNGVDYVGTLIPLGGSYVKKTGEMVAIHKNPNTLKRHIYQIWKAQLSWKSPIKYSDSSKAVIEASWKALDDVDTHPDTPYGAIYMDATASA
ncbi:MAG: hypothetical protein AB2L14_25295 [Candidatus Xenobiia bacterium LiM19]